MRWSKNVVYERKCRPIPWAPGEWSDAGQTIKQRTNNTEMLVMTWGEFTHHIKHWGYEETVGMVDYWIKEGLVDEDTEDVISTHSPTRYKIAFHDFWRVNSFVK